MFWFTRSFKTPPVSCHGAAYLATLTGITGITYHWSSKDCVPRHMWCSCPSNVRSPSWPIISWGSQKVEGLGKIWQKGNILLNKNGRICWCVHQQIDIQICSYIFIYTISINFKIHDITAIVFYLYIYIHMYVFYLYKFNIIQWCSWLQSCTNWWIVFV